MTKKTKVPAKKPSLNKINAADPSSYAKLLEALKADIQQTQVRAALSVTKELTG